MSFLLRMSVGSAPGFLWLLEPFPEGHSCYSKEPGTLVLCQVVLERSEGWCRVDLPKKGFGVGMSRKEKNDVPGSKYVRACLGAGVRAGGRGCSTSGSRQPGVGVACASRSASLHPSLIRKMGLHQPVERLIPGTK